MEKMEDRLSALPEHLIHHILSFLTISDAIRMCCLSKQWRTMLVDIPMLNILEFDKEKLRTKFVGLVLNCLNRGRQSQQLITTTVRFKLHLNYFYGQPIIEYGWLNSITETNYTLRELHLCINRYSIPKSLLNNVSSSLTILKLEGIILKPNSTISFPSLTSLSLADHSELEDFHTIESRLFSRRSPLCGLDLISCGSLRNLSLYGVTTIDSWLEDVAFGLHSLERLSLDSCTGLVVPNIRSQTLKYFHYYCNNKYNRPNIEIATFDTPNLAYFSYKGGYGSSKFLINSHNLLEANVKFTGYSDGKDWYFLLILFLSCLNCSSSTTLRLYFPWKKALLIPEIMKGSCNPPLPHLKHLKVKIEDTTSNYMMQDDHFSIDSPESRAALLWWAPTAETREIELIRLFGTD